MFFNSWYRPNHHSPLDAHYVWLDESLNDRVRHFPRPIVTAKAAGTTASHCAGRSFGFGTPIVY